MGHTVGAQLMLKMKEWMIESMNHVPGGCHGPQRLQMTWVQGAGKSRWVWDIWIEKENTTQ
jgi:hypothetical protein